MVVGRPCDLTVVPTVRFGIPVPTPRRAAATGATACPRTFTDLSPIRSMTCDLAPS